MNPPRTILVSSFALALACASGETTAPSAMPPALQEVIAMPRLDYPLALLHQGITSGEVRVLVKIGPDARLIDSLVTTYTHQALATYTLDALQRSKFRPLLVGGQPITTIADLVVRFETTGVVAVERHAVDLPDPGPGQYAYQPCDPSRLDRPLQAITTQSPAYPEELCRQGTKGSVVLDYYIDESGRVRMPIVHQTQNETLAGLSLAAVQQWQFSPPVSRNKPVMVRVRQQFDFIPDKPS